MAIKVRTEVYEEALGALRDAVSHEAYKGYVEVPQTLFQAVLDNLKEMYEGCDHSVGICMCSELLMVRELVLADNGRESCRSCAGEGFVAWKVSGTLMEGNLVWEDRTCPKCQGVGTQQIV